MQTESVAEAERARSARIRRRGLVHVAPEQDFPPVPGFELGEVARVIVEMAPSMAIADDLRILQAECGSDLNNDPSWGPIGVEN